MKDTVDPFVIWDKEIDPRIEELRKNNYHLEAFYLFSNTLEFVLRGSIMFQQDWINNLVNKSGLKYKKVELKKLESKTLGELISMFDVHYCKDNQLVDKLNNFNSFRVKVSHKILSHNILKLNNEAEKYYTTYNDLIANLCRYNMFLIGKNLRKSKNKIKKIRKPNL